MRKREAICHESLLLAAFFLSGMCESKDLSHAVDAEQVMPIAQP